MCTFPNKHRGFVIFELLLPPPPCCRERVAFAGLLSAIKTTQKISSGQEEPFYRTDLSAQHMWRAIGNDFISLASFASSGSIESYQHHCFSSKKYEWIRVTNQTQFNSSSCQWIGQTYVDHACSFSGACVGKSSHHHRARPVFTSSKLIVKGKR